jgi:hypothetical protein
MLADSRSKITAYAREWHAVPGQLCLCDCNGKPVNGAAASSGNCTVLGLDPGSASEVERLYTGYHGHAE